MKALTLIIIIIAAATVAWIFLGMALIKGIYQAYEETDEIQNEYQE